jgi:hypothetical protein
MMKMVKQRVTTDGTIAMDCGVCVIAMLTDLPYEKILADVQQYENTTDFDWMRYVNLLGFQVEQVDGNDPPLGRRLFCGIKAILNGQLVCHAIAVDESGHIFDPTNGAPEPGIFTLQQCLVHGTFEIHSCFGISKRLGVNPVPMKLEI